METKTKEQILKEAYRKIEDRQIADHQVEVILLDAMEQYRKQGRCFTEDEIRIIQEQHYSEGYLAGKHDN